MADLTLLGQGQEALRLLDARQPLQATAICHRILESFPKHVDTYVILGQIFAQTSRHEEALDLFRRVLGADPENLRAYVHMAGTYEQWGQTREALWHWQRAFELMPALQETRDGLQRLTAEIDPAVPVHLELTRAALARTYLRGQLYGQAIRELSDLVSTDPQRYDLRAALVEALERGGQYDAAAVAAQSLLNELPYCLKANLILGRIWLNTEQDQQARTLLQRAQALDPENRVAYSLFGAKSPLPLRIPRLPFRETDAEPVELPYLVDDEEVVAESVIIDAQAGVAEPESVTDETASTEGTFEPASAWRRPTQIDHQPAPAPGAASAEQREVSAASSTDRLEETLTPVIPEKMSLIDVQEQYLVEHSEDHQARLDLARHLRDMGHLDQALKHYQILVEGSYEALPTTVHDLELLSRLYPGTQAIDDVLLSAHEREKRVPPPSEQ
jgi:tetratricopeptide (TPR) repeat protein